MPESLREIPIFDRDFRWFRHLRSLLWQCNARRSDLCTLQFGLVVGFFEIVGVGGDNRLNGFVEA